MNKKIPKLFCLFVLCVSLPATFAYVMGRDDRIEVDENMEQTAAVQQAGKIHIKGEQFVSGVVIGANCDVVVTAGHAAYHWQTIERKGWRKGELRGQGDFRFNPDPANRSEWFALELISSGYEKIENIDKDEQDWSIFRTSKRALATCKNIEVLPNRTKCRGKLFMPAFHFDKPDTKLVDKSCSIKRPSGKHLVIHDCDTKDGSSGAPLLCQRNDRTTLLAINVSGLTRDDYYDAGVYGKEGRKYDDKQHKNYAVNISGEFYTRLKKELRASEERSFLKD